MAVLSLTMNFCNNSSRGSIPSRAACRRMACFTSSRTPLSAPRVAIRRSKIIIIILIYFTYARYENVEKKMYFVKPPRLQLCRVILHHRVQSINMLILPKYLHILYTFGITGKKNFRD